MNKYIKIFFIGSISILSSCDSDFDEINTDPTRADGEIFDPNLILPDALHSFGTSTTGYNGAVLFESMWVQVLASTSTGGANYYSNGDKYVASGSTNGYTASIWNIDYQSASKFYQMSQLASTKGLTNLAAIGDMLQVMSIGFVTDVYGDAPYSEALQLEDGISQPAYDKQENMYPQMLADLETAILKLNISGDAPTNDIYYDGDIAKWRKFGYSLMLKMAMRLVDADAATAKTYAEKAIAGGVFTSIDDEAISPTDNPNGFNNENAQAFNVAADLYEVRWSKTMIDFLKSTNDPRLPVVAEVPPAGLAANNDISLSGDTDPSIQIGLPNGYDYKEGATDVSLEPDYPGPSGTGGDVAVIGNYSRPTAIYRDRSAPVFILTYAQIELLLAEAAIRGYNVSSTASEYYYNGLVGAMETLNKYGGAQIASGDAVTYATANPLDISSTEASLKMINEQIWATTGLTGNYIESWNNWKRSDYPVLTPVNYTGNFSMGQIPT
ncbi:MAG: SusD/RagB family nutrient-binding outer membrane lipoprotein, partial [Leeuwenhoekiella sp.]